MRLSADIHRQLLKTSTPSCCVGHDVFDREIGAQRDRLNVRSADNPRLERLWHDQISDVYHTPGRDIMRDPFDYRCDLVKQEMETVQRGIDVYNRTLFTIKGLAITIVAAFVTFLDRLSDPGWVVFVAMVVILLLFWLLDALFKGIQKVYIHRAQEIEEQVKNPEFYNRLTDPSLEGLGFPCIETQLKTWDEKSFWSRLEHFMQPGVSIIYLAMIALVVALLIA